MTTFVHNDLDVSAAKVVASGQPLYPAVERTSAERQLQTMQTKHQQLPNSAQQFLLTQVLASTSLTMWSVPFGLRLKAGIKPK